MRPSRIAVVAALAVAALGAVRFAVHTATRPATHELVQQRRSFGVSSLSINTGDSLVFVNGDPYAHNVYSREPVGWLDLGLQEEGDRKTEVFDIPGTFDLRCRIHPKMQVTVTVK